MQKLALKVNGHPIYEKHKEDIIQALEDALELEKFAIITESVATTSLDSSDDSIIDRTA